MKKHGNKLVIFSDWYAPGYRAGGPIRSLTNLVELLKDEYACRVVTSNTDFGVREPYEKIPPNKWIETENGNVIYLNDRYTMFSFLMRTVNVEKDEVVYLNSLFSLRFTLLPLFFFRWIFKVKRIVVAPRGMLGRGALAIKGAKKQWFLRVVRAMGLFNGVAWHATSNEEADEIRQHFGRKVMVSVVPNIPTITTDVLHHREKLKGHLKLLFCSRISEKKNLLLALEIVKELGQQLNGSTIEFAIFGPIEDDAYWQKCLNLIEKMDTGVSVNYGGVLKPTELNKVFNEAHLLFLPTAHENYGHIVVEAMATGLPVLLSTNTPWRNLEHIGIGWDIDLDDKVKFVEVLFNCVMMDREEYNQKSIKTYEWIRSEVDRSQLKAQLKDLFQHQ